jgi:arginase
MGKQVQFIFNPSEIGAGTRGASLGPNAILTAARSKNSKLFQNRDISVITDLNQLLDNSPQFSFAKNIDEIITIYSNVENEINKTFKNGFFPIIIAGDHSSAGGTISAISKYFPSKKLGVLWIDAHADLHTPFTTPSGNLHGMPVAATLGVDNIECRKNEVDEKTIQHWNNLKIKAFESKNLVYIAVRQTEKEEDYLIEKLNIKNFNVNEVRELGILKLIDELKEKFKEIDYLYVSFDVDSMDPKETSLGTGTPVSNGLTTEEAKQILQGICQFEKLIALEIVEVNPCLDDKKNKMAETALDILESVIDTLEK